jgi:soluble lytic murein transglycosylase-like protein
MADFLKRLVTVQVPVHRLRKERRNLMVFASVAAVLAMYSTFQSVSLTGTARPAAPMEQVEAEAPAQPERVSSGVDSASPAPLETRRYRVIAEHLAKRYLVSVEAMQGMVEAAHRAGEQVGLDPLLIIAVMAVESRFNPIAESVAGAKGLMQVIPKYHLEKFEPWGGEKAALEPRANILVGAMILREYLNRTGNLSTALQLYAGAPGEGAGGYAQKVMSERQRLAQVVAQLPGQPGRRATLPA